MEPVEKEIEILIRARYPIIYITSWEEKRVELALVNISKRRDKKAFVWTVTEGLVAYAESETPKQVREGSTDPLAALDQVHKFVEPAIYIFKDFHAYLQDPTVIRKLRDLSFRLKNSYKTLILLSPILKIPPELEKEITVCEFTLPTLQDLDTLLKQILDQVKENPQVKVDLSAADREALLKAALGLTLNEAENVFAKAIVGDGRLDAADIPIVLSEKEQIIKKTGLLEYYSPEERLTDIGGLEILKEWLRKRKLAFSEEAKAFGLPPPKGILLLGVQGCGKSLTAKAVASLWSLPLLRLDMGRIFSSLVGSSESNARTAMRVAESLAPAILWVDEIEKAFSGVQSSGFSDAGTTARVFGNFITWLQEKKTPVFVIATANEVQLLPPELLRKGRFDEIFFVDLPIEEERKDIFQIHLVKRGRDTKRFDLNRLAHESQGFSGAEIEQAIVSALFDAFDRKGELSTELIVQSLQQTVPLSTTMKEQIDQLRSWAGSRTRKASSSPSPEPIPESSRKLEL